MINIPNLEIYVKLRVDSKLEKDQIKKFYKTVKSVVERDMIDSVSVINDGKPPSYASIINYYDDEENSYVYEIPLKKDISEDESKRILEIISGYFDFDFIFETSSDVIQTFEDSISDAIVTDSDNYVDLCEALTKAQHQIWYNERVENGWKYGVSFNKSQKTHPMLRPWQELPDSYKKIDYNSPQIFIEELNKQGFYIVDAMQLEKALKSK